MRADLKAEMCLGVRRQSAAAPPPFARQTAPEGGGALRFPPQSMTLPGLRCLQFRAFTLVEIMIVVAIMGLILAAGIPALDQAFRKTGFRKTLSDITDVCIETRKQAIINGEEADIVFHPKDRTLNGGGKSAKIDDNVAIEMLDVNLTEYKEAEEAKVRFFPNGTCDEMTLILHSPDKNQWRKITLEITTSLVSVTDSMQ